jgi:hypothetical protein
VFVVRLLWLLAGVLIVTGCTTNGADDPPPEPVELLTEAADNIRSAETFRMEVIHSGAPYLFYIQLPGEQVTGVEFRRAQAQYVRPDRLQATVRIIAGIPLDIDIFSQGSRQWYRVTGMGWIGGEFAPGFNPQTLIADDSGFQAALSALTELEYIGQETLEDGARVYHLRGMAHGPDVTDLMVGLIEAEGLVPVDVYIDRETTYPVRLVIVQPETATEETPQPTTWTIDVYDVGADSALTPPEDA